MTTARAITRKFREKNIQRRGEGAIYAVAMDDHNVHCLTESDLDRWWHDLDPEKKGALYEADLDGCCEESEAA